MACVYNDVFVCHTYALVRARFSVCESNVFVANGQMLRLLVVGLFAGCAYGNEPADPKCALLDAVTGKWGVVDGATEATCAGQWILGKHTPNTF